MATSTRITLSLVEASSADGAASWATFALVIAAVAWVFTVNRRGASSQQDHPPRPFYQGKHR